MEAELRCSQPAITSSIFRSDSGTESKWTIDNKYYTANVEFVWGVKDLFEGLETFGDEDEQEGGGVPPAIIWIHENDKVSQK